jgi:hypothetical protein
MLLDSLYQWVVFQAAAVDEIVRRRDLIGIGGSAQDLRHQLIRIHATGETMESISDADNVRLLCFLERKGIWACSDQHDAR